jgi:3',5'-cyclic AMP phosphodiesterase CpdA
MLIAQISDTHISQPDPGEPDTLERISMLQEFVAYIGEMEEKPDLILHTGDVSQDGKPEEYDIVKSMLRSIDIPVFFALGNRDLARQNWSMIFSSTALTVSPCGSSPWTPRKENTGWARRVR